MPIRVLSESELTTLARAASILLDSGDVDEADRLTKLLVHKRRQALHASKVDHLPEHDGRDEWRERE